MTRTDKRESGAALFSYDDPAILVLATSNNGRDAAEAAVLAAGARPSRAPIEGLPAIERIEQQIALAGLVIDIDREGAGLDALLHHAELLAQEGRCGSVIIFSTPFIDRVVAQVIHPDIHLLCDPGPIERTAAIGMMLARHRLRLHQPINNETDAGQLRTLSEEVGRIARTLAELAEEAIERKRGVEDRQLGFHAEPHVLPELTAAEVRTVIRGRRLRDRYFDPTLFADPAWDMLLDLMAARIEHIPVAVSSLCIAAAVPPTTALRWIGRMTELGLLVREADPSDGRRIFIALADKAAAGMTEYFAATRRAGLMPA